MPGWWRASWAATVGFGHLRPAAPTVERATLWTDTVKRGPMLREVRGTGTLVPEQMRWISAVTAGRIERILVRAGTPVDENAELFELSNPDVQPGLAFHEANTLSETLREQRLGALEATALLQRVMEEIDVAVFAFDSEQRLKLVNRAGERLLGRPAENLVGRSADELALREALTGEAPRVFDESFPGGAGRWEVRRSEFRQGGTPHRLLVLADLSRTLREEERMAWQRLVRVLSHEINNSLAPIKSIAESLQSRVSRGTSPEQLEGDVKTGLGVVAARAESLSRFMAAYARLARLPRPRLAATAVEPWVRRVVALETRLPVEVSSGGSLTIAADGDQLDQLLINLVRNAADAALETGGGVRVSWQRQPGHIEVWVEDDGPGLSDTENLFVPFFTTKPNGTGVGLALSRQIAEAHGGTLILENRLGGRGGVARLRLPVGADLPTLRRLR